MQGQLKACGLFISILLAGGALVQLTPASAQTCSGITDCANLAVQSAQSAAKAAASAVPVHTIIAWFQNSGPIPDGWAICDGSNGTPNLMGRYIQGGNLGEITASAFGSDTHQHSVSASGETGQPDRGNVYHVTDGGPPQTRGLDSQSPVSVSGTTSPASNIPPSVKIVFLMKIR
jgi:hypothetical protein